MPRVKNDAGFSREFLERIHRIARAKLPGDVYAVMMAQARASAGGIARRRNDQPTELEKLALTEIRPRALRSLSDDELRAVWRRLSDWLGNFQRQRQPIEDVVNAALWAADELERRDLEVPAGALYDAVLDLRGRRGNLRERLASLPREMMVVKNIVSIVGSTVTGTNREPNDVDVLIRAPLDREAGTMSVQAESLWVPVRNALDPEKSGNISWIGNAQGPHGDNVPVYDLVLRRREYFQTEVVKSFPDGEPPEAGIHVHRLERENSTTKNDGAHLHVFFLDDGRPLFTEEDGAHSHTLEEPTSNEIADSGEHSHRIILPTDLAEEWGVEELETSAALAAHSHQLQTSSSAFDGAHIHGLELPSGETIRNLWPGQHWERFGEEQAPTPPAPPATELAETCPGEPGIPIAFVGTSPSPADKARREPLTGQVGQAFNTSYLKALNMSRGDVALMNLAPEPLVDGNGKTREPTTAELSEWMPSISKKLDDAGADIVIALGQAAGRALGERADYVLPHPAALQRFGDSGEVARKLKKVRARLEKQEDGDDGPTRGERATQVWRGTWHKQLPTSGKGRFVYQHHWRGLEDDERGLSDRELLDTGHSLHGDIRLEGDDALWGFAVLIGDAADNKEVGGDKLIAMKPGQTGDLGSIELAHKLPQPKRWLEVGRDGAAVVGPGGVGATTRTSAKFFALDHGTYELGVARQNAVEIFLDGDKLKGRYLLQSAPIGGRRVWLIRRPEDQTPIAEQRTLADTIGDVARGQKFLIWARPGVTPQKIDVRTGEVVKSHHVTIAKADPVKRIVYGVVLDPYSKDGTFFDAHGDYTPPDAIEESAHGFGLGKIRIEHESDSDAVAVETSIEQYPSRADYLAAIRGHDHSVWRRPFGNGFVHSGSWVLGVKLGPKSWKAYQEGDLNAFSPGGMGIKVPAQGRKMPKVRFTDLVAILSKR